MHRSLPRLLLAGSCCLLVSCATPHAGSLALPAAGADEAYLMGRQHQLARSQADAMRLYRAALLADPQHVNARNGLASVLAEQGDYAGAIALWQGLTAQLPGAAYLFSNLGYAYFLDGQYAAAQQAQQRACLLDPGNPRAWQRLAATLEKRGEAVRALRTQRQALALLEHDAHADALLAASADGWARTTLVTGADGLLTLQRSDATPPAVSASASAPLSTPASLEIANGNGVRGFALATARRVRDPAVRVVRLTNQNGFNVPRTRIEYRPALKDVAQRLAGQVQADAVLVEASPGMATGLRLVLGRDAI